MFDNYSQQVTHYATATSLAGRYDNFLIIHYKIQLLNNHNNLDHFSYSWLMSFDYDQLASQNRLFIYWILIIFHSEPERPLIPQLIKLFEQIANCDNPAAKQMVLRYKQKNK